MPSIELDVFYGLLGALLFRIRNEQTDYQNWNFGFVIGLFLSQVLFVYGIETVGQIIWVISAMGLGVAYFLRFNRKVRRTTIDFLKLACIVLLIIYPITFYTIFPLEVSLKPLAGCWALRISALRNLWKSRTGMPYHFLKFDLMKWPCKSSPKGMIMDQAHSMPAYRNAGTNGMWP